MRRIPYGRHNITEDDLRAVNETLKSDFITQGPRVEEFEKAFADYIGVKYALAVCNGTAALHISAMALHVKPGQKVITTPITFIASANCIRFCGGEVAFSDIDSRTYLMDLDRLERMLAENEPRTYSGIIPVDFAGYPVNMEKLRKITDKYGLWIIEDACHAPGGYFIDSKGQRQNCGNCAYTDLAIFSFHPVKHIATGEGGMVTTNDEALYQRLLLLRNHGLTRDETLMHENHGGWYYEMLELSHNNRLTDFQAALGISQLGRADAGLERRRQLALRYDEAFRGTPIQVPFHEKDTGHAFHLYVVQVNDRHEFYDYLRENGIFSQIHYIPVHYMPYYKQFGWKKGDFPVAEAYYEKCISLPLFPTLSDDDQEYVIDICLKFFADK